MQKFNESFLSTNNKGDFSITIEENFNGLVRHNSDYEIYSSAIKEIQKPLEIEVQEKNGE